MLRLCMSRKLNFFSISLCRPRGIPNYNYKKGKITFAKAKDLRPVEPEEPMVSGTSDNGHSEEWTTSLQWTNCSLPAYILPIYFYIPLKKGQPLNNGCPNMSIIWRFHCKHWGPQNAFTESFPLYQRFHRSIMPIHFLQESLYTHALAKIISVLR